MLRSLWGRRSKAPANKNVEAYDLGRPVNDPLSPVASPSGSFSIGKAGPTAILTFPGTAPGLGGWRLWLRMFDTGNWLSLFPLADAQQQVQRPRPSGRGPRPPNVSTVQGDRTIRLSNWANATPTNSSAAVMTKLNPTNPASVKISPAMTWCCSPLSRRSVPSLPPQPPYFGGAVQRCQEGQRQQKQPSRGGQGQLGRRRGAPPEGEPIQLIVGQHRRGLKQQDGQGHHPKGPTGHPPPLEEPVQDDWNGTDTGHHRREDGASSSTGTPRLQPVEP